VKTFVDAFITIGPSATNNVGQPHTFTVTVKQNLGDGAGYVPATNGNVDVTLSTIAGSAVAVVDTGASTCDDNQPTGDNLDSNGTCIVVFTSSTPGTINGHAKVTIPAAVFGTANDVVRETDGTGQNSGDATKIFLAGSISWTKVSNDGVTPLGGATFQLCQTSVFIPGSSPAAFTPLVPNVCKNVVDDDTTSSATQYPDALPSDPGHFRVTGLSLGQYTVQETVAPAGFVKDPDTVPVQLDSSTQNFTITTPFVNTRPILKITGFGYTNSPIGTPVHGVTKGTTVYTISLHNYGNADANLTGSSFLVTAPASANLSCGGLMSGSPPAAATLNGTTIGPGGDATFTETCTYNGTGGEKVSADLIVQTTTNGLVRNASGSPAEIFYTIEAD
jgi:hypothetical protein